MKQGSTDDPFAEDPVDEEQSGDEMASTDSSPDTASDRSGTVEPTRTEAQQRQSLPYIHARDGVKDGRTQRPVFLRDHVETGIDGLVAEVEAEVGEDVYKTDVTEAAMAVALENPELVLAKLESWGYGWS